MPAVGSGFCGALFREDLTQADFYCDTSERSEVDHGRPRHTELGNLGHFTGAAVQSECHHVVRLQITNEEKLAGRFNVHFTGSLPTGLYNFDSSQTARWLVNGEDGDTIVSAIRAVHESRIRMDANIGGRYAGSGITFWNRGD